MHGSQESWKGAQLLLRLSRELIQWADPFWAWREMGWRAVVAKGCDRCSAGTMQASGRAVTETDAVHSGLPQRWMAATPALSRALWATHCRWLCMFQAQLFLKSIRLTVGCLAGCCA